jgi:hypothetical protein
MDAPSVRRAAAAAAKGEPEDFPSMPDVDAESELEVEAAGDGAQATTDTNAQSIGSLDVKRAALSPLQLGPLPSSWSSPSSASATRHRSLAATGVAAFLTGSGAAVGNNDGSDGSGSGPPSRNTMWGSSAFSGRRKSSVSGDVGTPGRVLIRLIAGRARANAAVKFRQSASVRQSFGGVAGAAGALNVDTTKFAEFSQDAIFNSPVVRSRHNSMPPTSSPAASAAIASAAAAGYLKGLVLPGKDAIDVTGTTIGATTTTAAATSSKPPPPTDGSGSDITDAAVGAVESKPAMASDPLDELNRLAEKRLSGMPTTVASTFLVCGMDTTTFRWSRDCYAAWGGGGGGGGGDGGDGDDGDGADGAHANRKLYRARVESQLNPSGFDSDKILDGIFPTGLRPTFEASAPATRTGGTDTGAVTGAGSGASSVAAGAAAAAAAVAAVFRTPASAPQSKSAVSVVDPRSHLRPTPHSFVITNESASRTYVSCLSWRERFRRLTCVGCGCVAGRSRRGVLVLLLAAASTDLTEVRAEIIHEHPRQPTHEPAPSHTWKHSCFHTRTHRTHAPTQGHTHTNAHHAPTHTRTRTHTHTHDDTAEWSSFLLTLSSTSDSRLTSTQRPGRTATRLGSGLRPSSWCISSSHSFWANPTCPLMKRWTTATAATTTTTTAATEAGAAAAAPVATRQ